MIIRPVLALVCLLLALAASGYLYMDIRDSIVRIKTAQDQVAALSARDSFAKNAAQFLAETAPERSAVQFFLTQADGTADAIALVEDAARVAGVKAIIDRATIEPIPETGFEYLNVVVSAEGTFPGMARFGTVLESLPTGAALTDTRLEVTESGWLGIFTVRFIKNT